MFRKRTLQERFWEILPGLSFWTVFLGSILLSYYKPVWAAIFIICFDLYWMLKAVNTGMHLVSSYRWFKFFVTLNWLEFLENLNDLASLREKYKVEFSLANSGLTRKHYQNEIDRLTKLIDAGVTGKNYRDYYHLVLIPFYEESFQVLDSTFAALQDSAFPKDKMLIVLAGEERAGESAKEVGRMVENKYGKVFANFFTVYHPDGLPDEIKGKSANASYAIKSYLPELEKLGIKQEAVIVSNLDSDTIVHPHYFAKVMYEFLLAEKPYQVSFQPIAIYNNNIWDSPAFVRVVSVISSFYQFTESSRPDRLRTFSSHSMTLKTLVDVGFWKKDIVNEDGYIYWQCYLHFKGDYQVLPMFLPASMDTCLDETFWKTLKNQYKQNRRWAYNVEYYPHLVPKLIKGPAPLYDRLYKLWQYVEGDFNWATASILISSLGWLPLLLGGNEFNSSVVAYNLPKATQILMTVATFFLIFSVYINLILLPPRPAKYSVMRTISMYLQWFLVPFIQVFFSSIPAVEAQTRLMFGYYLEFWVTPKARKGETTAMSMVEMKNISQKND